MNVLQEKQTCDCQVCGADGPFLLLRGACDTKWDADNIFSAGTFFKKVGEHLVMVV